MGEIMILDGYSNGHCTWYSDVERGQSQNYEAKAIFRGQRYKQQVRIGVKSRPTHAVTTEMVSGVLLLKL